MRFQSKGWLYLMFVEMQKLSERYKIVECVRAGPQITYHGHRATPRDKLVNHMGSCPGQYYVIPGSHAPLSRLTKNAMCHPWLVNPGPYEFESGNEAVDRVYKKGKSDHKTDNENTFDEAAVWYFRQNVSVIFCIKWNKLPPYVTSGPDPLMEPKMRRKCIWCVAPEIRSSVAKSAD